MKKIIIFISVLLVFGMILVARYGMEGQITRVNVQKVNKEENYEDVVTITDKNKINLIKNSLINVDWEPNTKAKMSRKEDVLVTLFYTFDKSVPEEVYDYAIWFNENEPATIISTNEKEGFGTLDKENSQNLKNILLQ